MSYTCYLGDMEVPTPAKLTVKVKGNNKTLVLLNEGEINFLRSAGLTEITLPLVLPMLGGKRSPADYLDMLENLKTNKKTTQFILVRSSPDGRRLYDTNMTVSIEDYSMVEDATKGLDVSVDVNLKQWRSYGTMTAAVEQPAEGGGPVAMTVEKEREEGNVPVAGTYTVHSGDTLWAVAARYYGSGSEYAKILDANTNGIINPNELYPGQVLTLP